MEYGVVEVGDRPELGVLEDLGSRRPKQLWHRGKWDGGLFAKCAAVVGSRRMTNYGQQVVGKLVPALIEEGYTVVSGFMYGVDQAAHEECIRCGGKTVAVLGWGVVYPMTHDQISMTNKILETGGLIISEWKDQQPAYWTFPARNRIVAAISQKIYVVEAASRSGALITAGMGRQLGREIWAVPGPVTSRVSEGTNKLIADGWARMWEPNQGFREQDAKNRDRKNAEIYIALQNEALTVDELVRKTGRVAEETGAELTMMVVRGEVVEKEGKYYLND